MAQHTVTEADGYKKQVHSGKAEERSKLEMNRVQAAQATSGPKSKDSGVKAPHQGKAQSAPGNLEVS